jgi:hypothetical protein
LAREVAACLADVHQPASHLRVARRVCLRRPRPVSARARSSDGYIDDSFDYAALERVVA